MPDRSIPIDPRMLTADEDYIPGFDAPKPNGDDRAHWFSDTLKMLQEQGYRATPVFKDGKARPYADGQTYYDPSDYRDAVCIGVAMDDRVLVDIDGNKDPDGVNATLARAEAVLTKEGLGVLVQQNEDGDSLHYLSNANHFPDGLKQSNDGWLPHIDLKRGNQLMHLKPHKIIVDSELPSMDELPEASNVLVSAFGWEQKSKGDGAPDGVLNVDIDDPAISEAVGFFLDGAEGALHSASFALCCSLREMGGSKESALKLMRELAPTVASIRGKERAVQWLREVVKDIDNAWVHTIPDVDRFDVVAVKVGVAPDIGDIWVDPETQVEPLPERFLVTPFTALNKTVDWLNTSSVKTHPVVSLAGGINIAQSIVARHYRSDMNNQAFCYLMVVLKSGGAKDYVRKAAHSILSDTAPERIFDGVVGSAPGLYDAIEAGDGCRAVIIDEFGDYVREAMQQPGSHKGGVLTRMRSIYSAGDAPIRPNAVGSGGRSRRDAEAQRKRVIYTPCLPFLGLTTKDQMLDVVDDRLINDGSINRFIMFSGDGVEFRFNDFTKADSSVPEWLIKHARNLAALSPDFFSADQAPAQTVIPFSVEAQATFNEIGDPDQEGTLLHGYIAKNSNARNIISRVRENAMRLALIMAAYEQEKEISNENLCWCYDLCLYLADRFVSQFSAHKDAQIPNVPKTYGQLKEGMLQVIREAGAAGIGLKEIGRCAPGRYAKATDRAAVISDLTAYNFVKRVEVETGGRPKVMLYAMRGE